MRHRQVYCEEEGCAGPQPSAYATTWPGDAVHILPRLPTPLIGRDHDIAAVEDLPRGGAARLLTLAGPGGVGKTRLAIAVAERMADAFADGVALVDPAPLRDATLVAPAIAATRDRQSHPRNGRHTSRFAGPPRPSAECPTAPTSLAWCAPSCPCCLLGEAPATRHWRRDLDPVERPPCGGLPRPSRPAPPLAAPGRASTRGPCAE
jgi:hypothetical protein